MNRVYRLFRYLRGVAGMLAHDWRKSRGEHSRVPQLEPFEKSRLSQHGEDGIIGTLFSRIGTGGRFFVEFGIEDGMECNTAWLARRGGWQGVMFEASAKHFKRAEANYSNFPNVTIGNEFVTAENIVTLFERYNVPTEFDLLSIDIDGNDYWIWKALSGFKPRMVVIEYNAAYPPPVRVTMSYDPTHSWNGTTAYGASLSALERLGRDLGYVLLGTDRSGVNAFFLRETLLAKSGMRAQTADEAYHVSNHSRFHPRLPYGRGSFEVV